MVGLGLEGLGAPPAQQGGRVLFGRALVLGRRGSASAGASAVSSTGASVSGVVGLGHGVVFGHGVGQPRRWVRCLSGQGRSVRFEQFEDAFAEDEVEAEDQGGQRITR